MGSLSTSGNTIIRSRGRGVRYNHPRAMMIPSFVYLLTNHRRCSDDGDTPGDRGDPHPYRGRTLYCRPDVTNHGLLTAGGIVALLAGGLALLGAGVPYSGVLLGALVVVSMLMGGVLFGVLSSLRSLRGKPALTGKEGMIGEVGTVKSPVGMYSEGWVFVHGERWRACWRSPRGRPTREIVRRRLGWDAR